MSQLIDLCGTPIRLDQIKSFRLVKRDYLFYPAYEETQGFASSVFARFGAEHRKKFQFVQMVPFGAVLGDKEQPKLDGYEIKSFDEALISSLLDTAGKAITTAGSFVADALMLDTSGMKSFRIMTQGRRVIKLKLKDIPAKVSFLSGKVSDVYKNDKIYPYLGETISPTVVAVPTLVVTVGKSTYAFFGNGIDVEDAESAYRSLLDAYNQHLSQAGEKKRIEFPKVHLTLPKLNLPFIAARSSPELPVDEPAQEEAPVPAGLSDNDRLVHDLQEHDQHVR